MQAVARIHRMNQSRETQVIRFVVNDTVEASLHRLTSTKAAKMDMMGTSLAGAKASESPLTLSDVANMLFDPQLVASAAS
jgi:SNF2 family DNA or RNA helicase